MKGLIVKDMALVWMQKRFLIVIALVVLLQIFSGSDVLFSMGFMTFIGLLLGLSTISYDEFENGSEFLFTLPIARKEYVQEKYLFSALMSLLFLLISILSVQVLYSLQGRSLSSNVYEMGVAIYVGALVMMVILLPFRLKFEGDTSRVAMIIGVGLLLLGFWGVEKLFTLWRIDVSSWVSFLSELNRWMSLLLLLVCIGVIVWISIKISTRIMEHKEF